MLGRCESGTTDYLNSGFSKLHPEFVASEDPRSISAEACQQADNLRIQSYGVDDFLVCDGVRLLQWQLSDSFPYPKKGEIDPIMEKFNESLSFDRRLFKADIICSKAYAQALHSSGILSQAEREDILQGLDRVLHEWESGQFKVCSGDEDIHTANERRLTELIGAAGGKLHTGRSRNDQVSTDLRWWLRKEVKELQHQLLQLMSHTSHRAAKELDIIMPGYTHLQRAQPVLWSHYLMSYVAQWQRDVNRLQEAYDRINVLPLGSGALAGNPFGIDRHQIAVELGFAACTSNSLDAVSDRDFVADTLFAASMVASHISKLAEDLCLFSSAEFGFVSVADAYSTGSSLMPQKRNPDACELARGKCGRVIGNLTGILCTMKGLPSTYNKDLQEDKEPLFDTVDTMKGVVAIIDGVVSTLTVNSSRMHAALSPDMLATDLADFAVRAGVPFREAHHLAGRAVALAEEKRCSIDQLSQKELSSIHEIFSNINVDELWSFQRSVEARSVRGGTAPASVQQQIGETLAWIDEFAGKHNISEHTV